MIGTLGYVTRTPQQVGDLVIRNDDGRTFVLDPLDDVTPLESVRITHLMAYVVSSPIGAYDWNGYIDKHNLRRHFREQK